MKKFYTTLFLNNRFFYALSIVATLFVVGFFAPIFFEISKVLLFMLIVLVCIDILILYQTKKGIEIERNLPERLSNGDENKITLMLKNNYPFVAHLALIEELPFQFQKRDFEGHE